MATVAAALLAACGEEAPSEDGRAATGEVLEGTISDAMLPLDQVRSQPPLVAPRPRPASANDADEGEAGDEPETTEEAGAVSAESAGGGATPAVEPAGEDTEE